MDARRSGNRIRILLATDDSPAARDAEAWALRLHAPAGGRLIEVATVAQGSLALGWQAQTYRDAVQEAVAGLREVEVQDAERVANAVGERLQSHADVVVHTWARSGDVLAALLALGTVTVRTELGDPAATVRAVARDEGTDLVVIPRTTRHRAGSLADRLIHGAQTSVLVVPAA